MTLKPLMVKLQSWIFGVCRVPFHCHYLQVHSGSTCQSPIYWLNHHHHHHHVMLSAQISQTLSHYPSQSSIASGRSSGIHPVSTQSCCMYVRTGRPAFARPCEGALRSTSLMTSSLLVPVVSHMSG